MKIHLAIMSVICFAVPLCSASAEVKIKGLDCSEFATKVLSKYARCSDEMPEELRTEFMKNMAPSIAATTLMITKVKDKDPQADEMCKGFAESFEGDDSMNLDAPGCD